MTRITISMYPLNLSPIPYFLHLFCLGFSLTCRASPVLLNNNTTQLAAWILWSKHGITTVRFGRSDVNAGNEGVVTADERSSRSQESERNTAILTESIIAKLLESNEHLTHSSREDI